MAKAHGRGAAAGLLGAALLGAAWTGAGAQSARSVFDFEENTGGFQAIAIKNGGVDENSAAKAERTTEKADVKSGSGALLYRYTVEAGAMNLLQAETQIPADARSVRLWVKSSYPTVLLLTAREADGVEYRLPFYAPAHEWTEITANLAEFATDPGKDDNDRLDAEHVRGIGVMDLANMLVAIPGLGDMIPGAGAQRSVWLDDLRFTAEPVTQSTGLVKTEGGASRLVDNFETGVIHWTPVKASFAGQPTFTIFPLETSLKVTAEAAGMGAAKTPLEPGGKGLSFAYRRGEQEAFGLTRSLDGEDLSRAERLKVSVRINKKSAVIVQVKEKDESEYQHLVMTENNQGWHNLDLALSELSLGGDSKDENGKLDPGQIKDITVLDGSALLQFETGDTVLDVDAVSFTLR